MPKSIQGLETKRIHIVTLDVPSPPDYGGAIDMFYRILALKELGYSIQLHCFEYGRGRNHPVLEQCAEEVHYYSRKKPVWDWLSKIPFIVKTRGNKKLVRNLIKDNSPILFEGIHTTFFLPDERLKNRLKLVRTHNIEHDYYRELSIHSKGKVRLFFRSEAKKLERYEPILKHANHLLVIQENDMNYYRSFHPSVYLLPASVPFIKVNDKPTLKGYALFHGNLSVSENINAVLWVIEALASKNIPLKIAGKNPNDNLKHICKENNVEVIENPSSEEMKSLVDQASLHCLYTDQATGLKLKLISALSTYGNVLVNSKMVKGTPLAEFCTVVDDKEAYGDAAAYLLEENNDVYKRHIFLQDHFDTTKNCRLFDQLLGFEQ